MAGKQGELLIELIGQPQLPDGGRHRHIIRHGLPVTIAGLAVGITHGANQLQLFGESQLILQIPGVRIEVVGIIKSKIEHWCDAVVLINRLLHIDGRQ